MGDWGDDLGTIKQVIPTLVQSMLRNSIHLTHKDGNNPRGMPEQPGGSSELSRNQNTGKPWQQRGTNMDGNTKWKVAID